MVRLKQFLQCVQIQNGGFKRVYISKKNNGCQAKFFKLWKGSCKFGFSGTMALNLGTIWLIFQTKTPGNEHSAQFFGLIRVFASLRTS